MEYNIEWLDTVGSTNTEMRERLQSSTPPASGKIIATRDQTAGRGRAGRKWDAGRGKNLCFSLYISTNSAPMGIPSLGMAVGLAVNSALREKGIGSRTKWPNDVRVSGRKICGILSESVARKSVKGAIVGVGINVNMTGQDTRAIDQPATSMLIETGRKFAPESVLEALLPHLSKRIGAWKESGFAGIRDEWMDCCEQLGDRVEIVEDGRILRGILRDFGENGECILRKTDGTTVAVWSGDVVD